jgi:hypothetical protein
MPAEEASLSRRLVASWAGNLPVPARDGDWLRVVEELLKDTIDLGHAGYMAYATPVGARTSAASRSPS